MRWLRLWPYLAIGIALVLVPAFVGGLLVTWYANVG